MNTNPSLEQEFRASLGPRYDEVIKKPPYPTLKGRPFWKVPRSFVFGKSSPLTFAMLPKHAQALLPAMKIYSSSDMCDVNLVKLGKLVGLSKSQVSKGIRYFRDNSLIDSVILPPRGWRRFGHAKKFLIGNISEKREGCHLYAIFSREIITGGHWRVMLSSEKNCYFVLLHGVQRAALNKLASMLSSPPDSWRESGVEVPERWKNENGAISWGKVMMDEWDDQAKAKYSSLLPVCASFRRGDHCLVSRQFLSEYADLHPDSVDTALRGLEKKRLILVLERARIGNLPVHRIFVPPPGVWMLSINPSGSEKDDTQAPKYWASAAEKADT